MYLLKSQKLLVLFIAVLGFISMPSCSKSDNAISDTKRESMKKDQNQGSQCDSDCLWGGCSADCPGPGASCSCFFGFADCDCEDNPGVITQTGLQWSDLNKFSDFLLTDLSTSEIGETLHGLCDDMQAAMDSGNMIEYRTALGLFRDEMNDLSSANRVTINEYLINEGFDPFFN